MTSRQHRPAWRQPSMIRWSGRLGCAALAGTVVLPLAGCAAGWWPGMTR